MLFVCDDKLNSIGLYNEKVKKALLFKIASNKKHVEPIIEDYLNSSTFLTANGFLNKKAIILPKVDYKYDVDMKQIWSKKINAVKYIYVLVLQAAPDFGLKTIKLFFESNINILPTIKMILGNTESFPIPEDNEEFGDDN